MTRVFQNRLHRVGTSDRQKAIANTDRAISLMILARDAEKGCVDCGTHSGQFDNGHFRRRECMPTRFHPMNLAKQNRRCNRFDGGRTFEFAQEIDRRWGKGTALFLEKLSRKTEAWDTKELDQLRSAARMGWQVYRQVYFDLRPHHRPARKSA